MSKLRCARCGVALTFDEVCDRQVAMTEGLRVVHRVCPPRVATVPEAAVVEALAELAALRDDRRPTESE